MNSNWSYSLERLNLGKNRRFFVTCDLQIWWMTLENNRAPLLYQIKLCASFPSHGWIQTGVTVQKRSIRVKIGDFLSCMILEFDGWPWNTIGHFFYTPSSFVHHFKAMGEFKLELQSGNAQFGSKSAIFWHVWPPNFPPVGSGTPAFRLGSRINPHRHRGVVKVHWRVPWVGGLFSWVVATFTL